MKISANWLRNPTTQSIMEILISDGYKAYFVGGCVRDALFNLTTTDVDIATSAHPKKVLEIMKKAGLKAIPTGICLLYTSPSPRDRSSSRMPSSA